MKFVAFEARSKRLVGVVNEDSVVEIGPLEAFYEAPMQKLMALRAPATDTNVYWSWTEITLVPPIPVDGRVFCVGVNFAPHAREGQRSVPDVPNMFSRWQSSLTVNGAVIPLPAKDCDLDWEGELAVVIGKTARGVDANTAQSSILGYTCFNDVTARRFQRAAGDSAQWTLGKNGDRTAPLGPWVLTPDEFGDLSEHRLRTSVNGEVMQEEDLANMIFTPAEVVSYVSGVLTLHPGDVITMGTPGGVGYARTPPKFLVPGDHVKVEINGLGELSNTIADVLFRSKEGS